MNTIDSSSAWSDIKSVLRKSGFFFKLAGIAFLGLLLLIPLGMVDGLLRERLGRQRQAVSEIRGTWGEQQTVLGPVLVLPYKREVQKTRETVVRGRTRKERYTEVQQGFIYLLPESLSVDAAMDPVRRYRGIYETVVYDARLHLGGIFPVPDLSGTELKPEHILWDQGIVTVAVSDLRGASRQLDLNLGGETYALLPGSRVPGMDSGVHTVTKALKKWEGGLPFAMDLQLHGSGLLQFAPLGVETAVTMTSTWPDPSFRGAFLPVSQSISPQGFQAGWEVSYYGRNFPQQIIQPRGTSLPKFQRLTSSLFGVELAELVDGYRPVERAIKYGVLFLVLVFGTFFLFEMMAGLRVHSFQYLLIGGALILFYLALLALSEFTGFAPAYAVGAGAATLLITVYSRFILGSGRRSLVICGGLAAVYGFLYVTLQMQDYALLSGTLGLFLLLAVAMYVTRHLHRRRAEDPAPDHGSAPAAEPLA